MRKISFRKPALSLKSLGIYLSTFAGMVCLNFALPQREPLAFPLFAAAVFCGLNPFAVAAEYVLASFSALSLMASISCAVQASFLLLLAAVYRRAGRRFSWEKLVYLACAQLPFIFLWPHAGYALLPLAAVWQKCILGALFVLASLLFEGGLHALLSRAFRCRLHAGELAQISLMWLFLGMGFFSAAGSIAFWALSLSLLLLAAILLKSAAAVPFGVVLCLPACVMRISPVPLAQFTVLACMCLLFAPYGRIPAALALFVGFLGVQYLEGLYTSGALNIVFTLLACALPAIAVCCIPDKIYRRLGRSLLFYRERTLPRIAINRNRRAVGEQLYEVSSLFREIETAFSAEERADSSASQLKEKLTSSLCGGCQNRRRCREERISDSLDKLIAVGKAKGRVNLIDLPTEISSVCVNSAGLLFALNRYLAEYRRYCAEVESAREGRRLLAQQAHGISEILRDIALEQSEEYTFSEEEHLLSAALLSAGILSTEVFLYGEGANLTVSLTLESRTAGKRLCAIASKALGFPLALAEKIPLTADRACFILRRKPRFDAAFGIASRPKEGEVNSGDTHSILKIDERRFLVALSDGMGSGEEARTVSDNTLSLLESFYKAKMPSETVLGTVNRLICFSAEETFSCLDLAAVNLDTGATDLVKIGSPVAFLLSGEELKILEGESLPIGMLEAVHPATLHLEMKENDFLIFMTDGVTTAFGSVAELCSYLSGLRPLNPQSLAEEILSCALHRYNGTAEDDMTVLAVKLLDAA